MCFKLFMLLSGESWTINVGSTRLFSAARFVLNFLTATNCSCSTCFALRAFNTSCVSSWPSRFFNNTVIFFSGLGVHVNTLILFFFYNVASYFMVFYCVRS